MARCVAVSFQKAFTLNQLVQELDEKLRTLDPARARHLELLVREAIDQVELEEQAEWPAGYFEKTAGVLAGEEFERPSQGELPIRENW